MLYGALQQSPPPIVLIPIIPGDLNVTAQKVSIEAFQPDFDVYSWNTFIALNWPPGPEDRHRRQALPPSVPAMGLGNDDLMRIQQA